MEAESPFHGDILETILSRLPLVHLFSALRVSKSWSRAVFSSLRKHNGRRKPWLILHAQCSRATSSAVFSAYDPRSRLWIRINHPPKSHASALRSSDATLLYTFSPARFSFSTDPLHMTWHHARPPCVWRTDPVVAIVGSCIVVAGGVCDFEDDPLAVEIYDLDNGTWETSEPMPSILRNSAASTWLSAAAAERKMYVMEKHTGLLYYFDTDSRKWSSVPCNFQLGGTTCFSIVIAFCRRGLIVVGLCGDSDETRDVRLWDLESTESFREVGSVPEDLTRKLKGESGFLNSIGVAASSIDDIVYVYNADEAGEVVTFEVDGDGVHRWSSAGHALMSGEGRVVYTCSHVSLGNLERAANEGFSFTAKE